MERALLILDLDETLIRATEEEPPDGFDFRVSTYFVRKRPHLDDFLEAVRQWYDLAVWSSAGDAHALEVADRALGGASGFLFVWGRSRRTEKFDEETRDYYFAENPKKVKRRGFSLERVLMLDDSPEKVRGNYGNHVGVRPFEGQPSDRELLDVLPFLTSRSNQSICLQRILKSRYTHMGRIYVGEDGNTYAYEAVQPVKRTPLSEWIERGEGGRYVVKRPREPPSDDELLRLKKAGQRFAGKPYDPYFQWSDDRIYCSELVWKIYKSALDIELGQLQRFGEFDLSDEHCSAILETRFPGGICTDDSRLRCIDPMEPVVTPTAVFESGKLVTVLQD